jgi:ribonuclease-3
MDKWLKLQQQMNIRFHNASLLREAFTHSSYTNEHKSSTHNERIEFLGDAVLQLAVAQYLYRTYPQWSEGKLTFIRSAIVREQALCQLAQKLSLGEYMILGKGEASTGGRERPSLLANVFEALVGAIYLDSGWDSTIAFLNIHMFPEIEHYIARGVIDAKSKLHEKIQQSGNQTIEYIVSDISGPANEREFNIEVFIDGVPYGTGQGRSKKEAEQKAAAEALARL